MPKVIEWTGNNPFEVMEFLSPNGGANLADGKLYVYDEAHNWEVFMVVEKGQGLSNENGEIGLWDKE